MQFRIEKHNPQHIHWLMKDIYSSLKNSDYLNQRKDHGHNGYWDWEIVYALVPIENPCLHEHRILNYMESIQRGDIIQPMVVIADNNVIDGRHKAEAYRRLKIKEAAIARPVGEGTGEVVIDKVYKPLIKDFKDIQKIRPQVVCIKCGNSMQCGKKWYTCECGYKILNINNLGWTVVNS